MHPVSPQYGWHAVPRNPKVLLDNKTQVNTPLPLSVSSLPYPDTALVGAALAHVKPQLQAEAFSHCLRVYYFGMSLLQTQFPSWLSDGWIDAETWLLTCLFHDIGTTAENLRGTNLSFDFWGGIHALATVRDLGAPTAQAESVCEAVLRHQDPGETGTINCLGMLTVEAVVREWPRKGWSGCFATTIREEIVLKPWAHSTAIDGFVEMVESNEITKNYD
ncbi:hypothetical protein IWX49DRAFT_634696 [Phyllosticta citricarpa]|uniref:HD domain-containing protein n=1 Tax=Phyllosticta paracitricarpa TaxID=2016321 RepID=A0ABR1NAU0_9PEZI